MSLPFQPESTDDLKARSADALEPVFVAGHTGPDRPGTKRSQVFDTEDGLRFIISREYAPARPTLLHVSVSRQPEADMPDLDSGVGLLVWLIGRIQDLIPVSLDLRHVQHSEAGVLHFIFSDIKPEEVSP